MTNFIIPAIVLFIIIYGLIKNIEIYDAFIDFGSIDITNEDNEPIA